MLKSLIICIAFLLNIYIISAIVEDYSFISGMGTYTPITDGTVLGTSANDDHSFNAIPIGFDFVFDWTIYNNISVNTNGFVVFDSTAQSSYTAINNPNANASNHLVAALNRDLKSKTTGSLMYKLIGTQPNRVFVIQWSGYQRYGSPNSSDTLNFQIRFNETTNVIEIQYGYIVFGNTNLMQRNFQVGLRGNSNVEFNNRKIAIGENDWANSIRGTNSTDYCEMSPTLIPLQGLSYVYFISYLPLPTQAEAVLPLNDALDVPINTSLTWTSDAGNILLGYLVFFGTDNPPANIANGTHIGTQTSYSSSSSLSYSTTYYWQIIPYNQYGNALVCPVWSFTTLQNPISIDDPIEITPVTSLHNYPNPFNPETTISYTLSSDMKCILTIFNTRGQLVKTLVSGIQCSGIHSVVWNGTNDSNESVASGVYLYRLQTKYNTITLKMLMVK